MKLQNIMLREIRDTKGLRGVKFTETECRPAITRGWSYRRIERYCSVGTEILFGMRNKF